MDEWGQARLEQLIADKIEESAKLEFKSAAALGRSPAKKKQIAKDVSAMANAIGGLLIYGISEDPDNEKRHLPQRIDPVDRSEYSKEWLAQVIDHNIQPTIAGLVIHPVPIDNSPNNVVYAVEIPESTTAHQVTADGDLRYYKRQNFESVPMEDHEVRLVMSRGTRPNALVEFGFDVLAREVARHTNLLRVTIKSDCPIVIRHLKLQFTMPKVLFPGVPKARVSSVRVIETRDEHYLVTYFLPEVLFPGEAIDITKELALQYQVDYQIRNDLAKADHKGGPLAFSWNLFADEMPPRSGKVPLSDLHYF